MHSVDVQSINRYKQPFPNKSHCGRWPQWLMLSAAIVYLRPISINPTIERRFIVVGVNGHVAVARALVGGAACDFYARCPAALQDP